MKKKKNPQKQRGLQEGQRPSPWACCTWCPRIPAKRDLNVSILSVHRVAGREGAGEAGIHVPGARSKEHVPVSPRVALASSPGLLCAACTRLVLPLSKQSLAVFEPPAVASGCPVAAGHVSSRLPPHTHTSALLSSLFLSFQGQMDVPPHAPCTSSEHPATYRPSKSKMQCGQVSPYSRLVLTPTSHTSPRLHPAVQHSDVHGSSPPQYHFVQCTVLPGRCPCS